MKPPISLFVAAALIVLPAAIRADVPSANFWHNPTFELGDNLDQPGGTPTDWNRGGNNSAICQVTTANSVSPTHSLVVNDTDSAGYGEWYSDLDLAGHVNEGDDLDLHWHELFSVSGGEMRLTLLFFDAGNGVIGQKHFVVSGQSAGWAGSIAASTFVLRDERVPIAAGAVRIRLSLVSGGGLDVTGVLVIDDLSVTQHRNPILLANNFWHNPTFELGDDLDLPTGTPTDWNRGGSNPDLCEVSTLNSISPTHSLAAVDTDINGYTEWYSDLDLAGQAGDGDQIDIQWFELYSLNGDFRVSLLFFDAGSAVIGQFHFVVHGQSEGFTGDFSTSPFVRRLERVPVSAGAVRIRLSLVSGGALNATGTMLIDDLSVAKVPPQVTELLPGNFRSNPGFEEGTDLDQSTGTPTGWSRGGNDPTICQVSMANAISPTHSLALVDQNAAGYGEWYGDQTLPCVARGGRALDLQWFEIYDISVGGAMRVTVLFFDAGNAVVGENHFVVTGQSAGFTGDFATSPFVRRNEQVAVPAGAVRLRTSLVSGGGLDGTGTMLIDNLSVAVQTSLPVILFGNIWPNPGFELGDNLDDPAAGQVTGWSRGGSDAGIDLITTSNYTSSIHALAVQDNNTGGYGEWYANLDLTGRVTDGETLSLQWFEAYNVSQGGTMRLTLLFFDSGNVVLSQQHYLATGSSPGWGGDLACSTFSRRNEQIIVPAGAVRLQVSLVSGGPVETTGVMAIDDLSLAPPPAAPMVQRFNFWPNPIFEEGVQLDNPLAGLPAGGWNRGGSDSRICQVSHEKASSPTHALAVVDANASGYGEWYMDVLLAGQANPGEILQLQWLEVFDTTGEMRVSILFFDQAGPTGVILQQTHHVVNGQSTGWTGDLASSPFVKYNQEISVPVGAVRLRISLVSGGAESVTGTMIIDDLSVQTDRLRILSAVSDDGLHLTWNTKPGQTYAVDGTTELSPDPFWVPLATGVPAGDMTASFTDDLSHGNRVMFYRIRQE